MLPQGHKEMSPEQLALEVALHELTILHGLHVTDVPDTTYTWDINTSEATEMIARVLEQFRSAQCKGNVQDET